MTITGICAVFYVKNLLCIVFRLTENAMMISFKLFFIVEKIVGSYIVKLAIGFIAMFFIIYLGDM